MEHQTPSLSLSSVCLSGNLRKRNCWTLLVSFWFRKYVWEILATCTAERTCDDSDGDPDSEEGRHRLHFLHSDGVLDRMDPYR